MVKKIQKSGTDKKAAAASFNSPLSGAIKDSAQQIWLAGLGAFSKAQEEGGKAFESLVKEGLAIQRKTQAVAEERISEATSRVTHMATDISSNNITSLLDKGITGLLDLHDANTKTTNKAYHNFCIGVKIMEML